MPGPILRTLLAMLTAAAGSAGAADIQFVEAQNAITIAGSIVAGDDLKFEAALLDRRPDKVVIRSDGGKQVPSLAIARLVHARRMTVIVDGFCASACAQIIFPAAEERRIRPDSFVAFHGGNLAIVQAVRAKVRSEQALQVAPADAAGAAADDPALAERRTRVEQALAGFEARLDEIETTQAAFDTGARLDPAVVGFYERLTAPRDIGVQLRIGEAQPVWVSAGRPGICDWWIPDREGLARLGLSLRNAYDVPKPELIAQMAGTTPARLYFGPPVAVDDPAFETLCPSP